MLPSPEIGLARRGRPRAARAARASTSPSRRSASSSASRSAPRSASPFGAVVGLSKLGDILLSPTLGAIRAVPSLAWVPLLILWFKIGEDSKIILIAIGAFFPVYTIVAAALRHVDHQLVEAGRAFGLRGVPLFADGAAARGRPVGGVRAAARARAVVAVPRRRRAHRVVDGPRVPARRLAATTAASTASSSRSSCSRCWASSPTRSSDSALAERLPAEEVGMTTGDRQARTARDDATYRADRRHSRRPRTSSRGRRRADADPVAFWEREARAARLGDAVAHRARVGARRIERRPRRPHRPAAPVVRRRRAERRGQLRGPARRRGPGRQGGAARRGRARRPPHAHLRRAAARGRACRERARRPRHRPGRPRRRLPAGARRDRHRDAGDRAHRRRCTRWCSAGSPPRRCGSACRTRAPSCSSPATGSSAAAGRRR